MNKLRSKGSYDDSSSDEYEEINPRKSTDLFLFFTIITIIVILININYKF